jgi:hypothetical protein
MRTRPTSGLEMNQVPPPIMRATARTRPATVDTCVEVNVVMTGPSTQMISCAEASREKRGVSCVELTILG